MLDEAAQAACVCAEVLAAREAGVPLKAQAVLFRAAHHSGPLEVELVRRNIPFVKFGGLKFLEAAHVKDVLACCGFAENPRDRMAGFRVLQLLPGVGPAAAEAMLGDARRRRAGGGAPAEARRRRLAGLRRAATPAPRAARSAGRPRSRRSRAWYDPHLARLHEDAAVAPRRPRAARADRRRLRLARGAS